MLWYFLFFYNTRMNGSWSIQEWKVHDQYGSKVYGELLTNTQGFHLPNTSCTGLWQTHTLAGCKVLWNTFMEELFDVSDNVKVGCDLLILTHSFQCTAFGSRGFEHSFLHSSFLFERLFWLHTEISGFPNGGLTVFYNHWSDLLWQNKGKLQQPTRQSHFIWFLYSDILPFHYSDSSGVKLWN